MVPLEGLEPPTRDLGRRRSILAELQGHVGGDRGARTPNLGVANAALSQLSYIPTARHGHRNLDGLKGIVLPRLLGVKLPTDTATSENWGVGLYRRLRDLCLKK